MSAPRNIAVVLASGTGSRFGASIPKQFLKLAGKTVFEHTLDVFERHPAINEIIVVCAGETRLLTEEIVCNGGYRKVGAIVNGGATRQLSSASGIEAIRGDEHKVLVHDAVRPLLDHATIDRCLQALESDDAVDTAIPASDTIIRVDESRSIVDIPDRSALNLGQTPQGFRAGILRRAHRLASLASDLKVTDDCGLILHFGLCAVRVVLGDVNNIKITYPSDIYLADRIFQLRSREIAHRPDPGPALEGKAIVVFGGARGIGEAVGNLARERGALVKSASRSSGVDVGDPQSVARILAEAVQQHGPIDAVINSAAVLRSGLLSAQSYDQIDEQLFTNLRGSIVVAREAFESMRGRGGSIALFTSSSYTRGRARYSVYSATKAAVVNLTHALAEEFRPFNVRINAINPERTATPMRTENFGVEPAHELLTAEQVAIATLHACLSPATGEVIDVRR